MNRLVIKLGLAVVGTIALSSGIQAAVPPSLRLLVVATPSGVFDTRFRDGNDGVVLNWGVCSNISVFSGSSVSINLRMSCALSEPGSPDATLATTCTPALGSGWADATHGLAYSGTGNFSATCRTSASRSGQTALSNYYSITSQAPPSVDSVAPTVPTGLSYVPDTGQVSFDASSDPHTTQPPSGLANYQIEHSVSGVSTISATGGGQPPFAVANIASVSPAPTANQTGSNWSLSSEGEIDGTDDAGLFLNAAVTGNFISTVKVVSMTNNGASFPKAGLIARASNTATSAALMFCGYQGNGQSQARRRLTAGSAVGGLAASTATLPRWYRLTRTDTTWSCDESGDGNQWTRLRDHESVPMGTTAYAGLLMSGATDVQSSAEVQQFSLTTVDRVTPVYSVSTAGTIRVRATDAESNVSSYGATVAVTPPAAPGIKWHPGHYMLLDPNINVATQISHIDELSINASGVQGVQARIWWGEIETAKDVYDWSCVDQYLDAVKRVGKRLVVQVMDRRFATSSTNIRSGCTGKAYPAYLHQEGMIATGGFARNGTIAKLWEADPMTRYIALMKAILARYDDDDKFEMISTEEISPGLGGGPVPAGSGFTSEKYANQWKRMVAEVAAVRRRTGLNLYTNSLAGFLGDEEGEPEPKSIMEALYANAWASGGPDTVPDNPTPGDNVRLGGRELIDFSPPPNGLRDYRGKIPDARAVQSPELGGSVGDFLPAQLAARAEHLVVSHIFWIRLTWNAGSTDDTQKWPLPNGILKYINDNPSLSAAQIACPTQYPSCDTSN